MERDDVIMTRFFPIMKRVLTSLVLFVFVLSFSAFFVSAHPGRTDSKGGHYNRKTGEYHYHNGGGGGSKSSGQRQSDDFMKKVQKRLNELGYDCGTPDGIKGEKTTNAIKAFQKDKGLEPDGEVGPKTKEALGL